VALFGSFFAFTVSRETSGPTATFFRWSRTTQRARSLYPTFTSFLNAGGIQLYPHPTLANCELYTDAAGTNQWPSTNNFFIAAYCTAGWVPPSTTETSSASFEDEELRYMNRALRFRGVPDEVMPK
jgi:hypothetical protein